MYATLAKDKKGTQKINEKHSHMGHVNKRFINGECFISVLYLHVKKKNFSYSYKNNNNFCK